MSRFLMIFTLGIFAALSSPMRAQSHPNDTFEYWPAPATPPAPRPWIAATKPNPRFPFHIIMVGEQARWDGFNYVGLADVYLPGQRENPLLVKYICGVTFTTAGNDIFEARWAKQDRKLDVLLLKPNSKHTQSCRYRVVR